MNQEKTLSLSVPKKLVVLGREAIERAGMPARSVEAASIPIMTAAKVSMLGLALIAANQGAKAGVEFAADPGPQTVQIMETVGLLPPDLPLTVWNKQD